MLKLSRMPLFPLIVARERLTRTERAREPEPMVMDEADAVEQYDAAGETVQLPIHHFNARAISRLLPHGGTVIDLGCGSGRLLARLAHARPDARIIGLDLSAPMLETGRQLLEREGVANVELRNGDITKFDADIPDDVDVISCNFALHQLPDTSLVSQTLSAIARARERTGCAVWIFDLARLRHPRSWPDLVSLVEMPGPAFHADTLASERAAYTTTELADLARAAGLSGLNTLCARPLGEYQVHWAAASGRPIPGAGQWNEVPLPSGTRLAYRLIASSFPRSLQAQ
jgi:SAM-dependent methyltransferase